MPNINHHTTLHEAVVDEETGEVQVMHVTKEEREYIDARIDGKDSIAAMKEAGISPWALWRAKSRGDMQLYMRERIFEAGLDHKPVIRVIKDALDATKYVTVGNEHVEKDGDGKGGINIRSKDSESIEVPDHAIRLQAVDVLLELQGIKAGDEVAPTVFNNTVNFIKQEDIENREEGELLAMTVARARAIKEGKTFVVPNVEKQVQALTGEGEV